MNDSRLEMTVALRMRYSRTAESAAVSAPAIVCRHESEAALQLAADPDLFKSRVPQMGAQGVLWLDADAEAGGVADAVSRHEAAHGTLPDVVVLPKKAVFVVGKTPYEAYRVQAMLFDPDAAMETSRHWAGRRLAGRVAVITGSAQGFGRGIAESLAAEGACIWVADLQDEAGQGFARELNERHGRGIAAFWRTDVTDADSVRRCIAGCVQAFGGVDLLVSNAGVLRAGGLDEIDEQSFDLVTAVNYKAYFLCVKAVAPVMKLQHRYKADHTMDIVQVNSKSGLEGSNRNFAYAGSKFGGLGLTQSFALELVQYNIKVNAVCPGNYFDGPLWSDPEKGLFVQYLRAGKVPGAETVQDVRDFYLSKVPMKRGCLPADVAKAIMYLHEQEYETGQALPVTGGQVMLN